MAIVRKSLKEILASPPGSDDVDWAKLRATTDEDIARQIAEDADTAPDHFGASGKPEGTPAARSLLILVARDPEGTLAALAAARSAA